MTDKQLSSYISVLVPRVLKLLMERKGLTEDEAIRALYTSKMYEALEDESTKIWRFSAETLCALLEEELATGQITYPEEL